ncbi:hypothetical protein IE81DRAFT_318334 [Ceraceosorus guamensis]|uniref:Rab-GAP TBC domain-containing protein n=1 Tax=Ceraceosorus guamensis TaxID=1522189 RepID=A0A316VPC2_9BASI|nr:hypothetical protein IE81DRAFT_318334 [Ceraceosorus guamensis]PWN39170.1 hypothetical protein IE81DRAFT_318334 [Ceraceosorus guamensis]
MVQAAMNHDITSTTGEARAKAEMDGTRDATLFVAGFEGSRDEHAAHTKPVLADEDEHDGPSITKSPVANGEHRARETANVAVDEEDTLDGVAAADELHGDPLDGQALPDNRVANAMQTSPLEDGTEECASNSEGHTHEASERAAQVDVQVANVAAPQQLRNRNSGAELQGNTSGSQGASEDGGRAASTAQVLQSAAGQVSSSSDSSKSQSVDSSHKRMESVVPQRYDLPELSPFSMQAASGSGSGRSFRRSSLVDLPGEGADSLAAEAEAQYASVPSPTFSSASYTYADGRPLRPVSGQRSRSIRNAAGEARPRSRTYSEDVEPVGFVDVALESPAPGSALGSASHDQHMMRSPYGAGVAFGSRSSVEIRQDSIASGSSAAQRVAAAAAHRDRMLKRAMSQEGGTSQSNSENGSLSLRSSFASGRSAPATGNEESRNSSESVRSSATDRKMAGEGRYMGRRSRPSSRAVTPTEMENAADRYSSSSRGASPVPTQRGSATFDSSLDRSSAAAAGLGHSSTKPGISMMVAGEDGEILEYVAEDHHASASRKSDEDQTRLSEVSAIQMTAISLEEEQNERKEASARIEPRSAGSPTMQTASPTGPDQDPSAVERREGSSTSSSEDPTSTSATSAPASEVATASTEIDRAPGLRDIADSEPGKKNRRKSNGPSALEQYMSRTRMTTLPPKERTEDAKHLSDFEQMMRSYKQAEKKKLEENEERKRQKDAELASAQAVWTQEILPSWTRARRENRLRAIWWKGAPPNLRGRIWALACGNAQMLPRNLFQGASAEAQKAIKEGRFPKADAQAIEADIANTLPSLKLFQRDVGPLYDDLRDVLQAYVMVRLDQLRATAAVSLSVSAPLPLAYQAGASSLAAMLLSNLSPTETLVALLNLLAERPWLRALYTPIPSGPAPSASHMHSQTPITPSFRQDAAAGFERVFDTLLADQMPKVYANMQARGVRPSAYVRDWARTLFVPFLPFDAVARLWDCILLEEGDALIFRIGLAIVKLLSARLYVPDKTELTSILRGNNAAALRVYYRDAALSSPGGLSSVMPSSATSAHLSLAVDGVSEYQTAQLPTTPSTAGSTAMLSPASTLAPSSAGSTVIADASWVPRDNIYAQYGINEEMLFQALEEQDEWWRDSTLERLLDRELG